MSDTALNLTHEAARDFLERNKNLLALTKEGAHRVMQRIEAALTLMDADTKNDVLLYLDTVDQKGHAGVTGRADFKKAIYVALCEAFIRAQHNLVITFATRLTREATEELEEIERVVGLREALPPPPPVKSQAELLEEQVREDWRKLPTDKLKAKLNNRDYKTTFDRLMAANELESVATSYTDGSAEFRQ